MATDPTTSREEEVLRAHVRRVGVALAARLRALSPEERAGSVKTLEQLLAFLSGHHVGTVVPGNVSGRVLSPHEHALLDTYHRGLVQRLRATLEALNE